MIFIRGRDVGRGRADGVDCDVGRSINSPTVLVPAASGKPLWLGPHLRCS
jgi:hypothetical protein